MISKDELLSRLKVTEALDRWLGAINPRSYDMSNDNVNEGPLSRLSRALGLDGELAPIAAVKRIDERPVSLNPECMFKMAPMPDLMSDTGIHALEKWKDRPTPPSEITAEFLSTTNRRKLEFDRVPIGHDMGYRCYDGSKHDPESAFSSGEYGDGLSEDEAYADWLRNVDEPPPRAGHVVHSSPFEPPTTTDDYRDPDAD